MNRKQMRRKLRHMAQDMMDKIMRRPPRPKTSALQVIGFIGSKSIQTFPFKIEESDEGGEK